MSREKPDRTKYPVLERVDVPGDTRAVWQDIVDLMADIFRVPAALIMRVHARDIEVFVCNRNTAHPYRQGLRERLDTGRYCEEVMSGRRPLLVPDAPSSPRWAHNPDLSAGMISYLGMPITWPEGEVFGTICVLDSKSNAYSGDLIRLMHKFAHLVESDLRVIWSSLQISRAHEELHRLNDEMNRFMGIAAHDMRNALNVFMGCSRYLLPRGDGLSQKERIYLDLIDKSGSTLIQLMDELMDVARIKTMHLPLHLETVNLIDIVAENVQYNQHLAEDRGIRIHVRDPGKPVMVRVDPAKIEQVLNNLISNALKYSPAGSAISVSIDAAPERVVVSIRDQGLGIPKDEQPGLFNPFHTTSIRPSTGETSTGLGLFIARRIVEEHGGRIWLESEPGAGSVFSFSLARVRQAPRHAAQKKGTPAHTRNIA